MIAVLVWFVVCSNGYNYALLRLWMWSGWVLVYWFLLSEIETSFVDSTHTHTHIYIYMLIGPILLWPQRWVADTHPPRNKVSTHILCVHIVWHTGYWHWAAGVWEPTPLPWMNKEQGQATGWIQCFEFRSVLWHCCFGDRKDNWPIKNLC